MRRRLVPLLALVLLVVACGDHDESGLTSQQAEWCSFSSATDEAADRFDQIFEAGLGLGLPMDQLNATAAKLLDDYEAAGMASDEAVQAVSNDLLGDGNFIAACMAAFEIYGPG